MRDLPATQRFETWRNLFPYIDIDWVEREKVASLQGQVVRFVSDEGYRFGYVQNDNTAATFGRDQRGIVIVALTLAGRCMIDCADDTAFMVHPATGVVVIDGAKPVKVTREGHSVVGLALPRGEVMAVLGADRELPEAGAFVLPLTGLTRLLASHLCEIAKESDVFDQEAANIAVQAAANLAFGAVSQGLLEALAWTGGGEKIYDAAQRYIDVYCGAPNLKASEIAAAVGCSRAQLYRSFAEHGETVGDAIRVARLLRACRHLQVSPTMPIQVVAYQCGYSNAAAFTRAFREELGCTPSEFRQRQAG